MGLVKEWTCRGFLCRVLDGPFRNYNGYIAVPKSHSAYGKKYGDLRIDVHGGLTFGEQGGGVDSDLWPNSDLWWFGFDTSHYNDRIEYMDGMISDPGGIRWTVEMVAKECESMAAQFAAMKDDGIVDGQLKGLLDNI